MVGAREVAKYSARSGDELDIAGIAQDGSSLVALSYGQGNTRSLFSYQFGAGSLGAAYFENPQYDIDGLFKDDWTGRLSGVSWVDDKVQYKYFDPKVQHIKERIEHALPGQSIQVVSWDQAGQNYVVRADAPKNPQTFYLFNPQTGQLSLVGSAYPSLTAADLGEERAYTYKSKDGTDIHAYLTLPPGKSAKIFPRLSCRMAAPKTATKSTSIGWRNFLRRVAMPCSSPISEAHRDMARSFATRAMANGRRACSTTSTAAPCS